MSPGGDKQRIECGLQSTLNTSTYTTHIPPAYQTPPGAPTPAPAPAPAPAPRTTGLNMQLPKAADSKKARLKRKAAPTREGPAWKSVKILKDHDSAPQVQCLTRLRPRLTWLCSVSRVRAFVCT